MSKFTQYLKATAIALLVPFSASAQKKASEKDPVKMRIAALSQSAGKYNLWDDRKPTDYDATHNLLKYPVKINYTIDSLSYISSADAYIEEAIVANFERKDSTQFSKKLPSSLVHECLHYIQASKINHLLQQPGVAGLTFQQAYELSACKEIAAHISDQIADELGSGKKINIADISRIANEETNRYMTEEGNSPGYRDQYFRSACNIFDPKATEESGNTTFMKLKAAIMTQYINVDNKMQSICLLPLLTDANANLLQTPASEIQKYENEKEDIHASKQKGGYHDGINSAQQFTLMRRRLRMHTEKLSDSDPLPLSVRSDKLSMDVSAFFPAMTAEQFTQAQNMITKIAQNEHNGQHVENQDFIHKLLNCKENNKDFNLLGLLNDKTRE